MSRKTRKTLSKVADVLEAAVQGFVTSLELVVQDLGARKRSRRTLRAYQHKPYVQHRIYRQPAPVIVVKVVGAQSIEEQR